VTAELATFTPGPTANPHDETRTPGGSSSGSAAAVAASMVPLALGSQTVGSTIRPASFCGVVGYKPTYGRVSRRGMLALSNTFDTVGLFARSLGDVALLFDALDHFDGDDPAMRLQAPVTFVKRVRAGTPISYGGTWATERDTTIATVRAGYADGYPRLLSSKGVAALHDRQVPVAGRVCMDQLMLDVGDLEVHPGDTVTLWGPPGPGAESLARGIGTIAYELLTRVSPRVPRRYLG